MKSIFKKLEKVFAAAAFAEMNEPETAIQMAGLNSRTVKKTSASWDSIFAAVTFAEAGCSDLAQEFLGRNKKRTLILPEERTLERFLSSIGLQNAPIHYGLARI
jgi:hypothetical protein